jgi:Chromo (CHRromatin Organisation MOdifier) domain
MINLSRIKPFRELIEQASKSNHDPYPSAPDLTPRAEEEPEPAADDEYEVEEIVDHRIRSGRQEFRIRWKGYSAKDDTWEDEARVKADHLLDQYWASQTADEAEAASS